MVSEVCFRAVLSYLSELATVVAEQGLLRVENREQNVKLRATIGGLEQAETAVQETKELLALFIKHSPIFAYIKEVSATQSRVLVVSDNFQKMVGIPSSAMVGKTMAELFPADFAAKITADDWAVVCSGTVLQQDEELAGQSYTTIKFPITSGNRKLLAGYTLDITDQKRAEAALRASEEQHRAILTTAMDGFWRVDLQGRLLVVNEALCRMTGYREDELLTMRISDLDISETPAETAGHIEKIIKHGEARFETRHRRKDGSSFEVEISAQYKSTGAGQIVAFLRDVTERKQAEAARRVSSQLLNETLVQLQQTQQQLVQQESLRALGQMVSGIAHDFNNALAPIIGFSELLLKYPEKLAEQEPVVRQLQIINTCANDAARVVRQMRDFGRQHAVGEIAQHLDLNQLVRQTIEITQPRWKNQAQAAGCTIQIATDLRPVPPIIGTEFAIRELLTNLIFNAVDALPAGGTITLGTMVDGQFVRVWVSDTGAGMTEAIRQRCFEPFFTTKGTKRIGLGLAMVRGIAHRYSGTVEAASQPGQGATFTVRLPIQNSTRVPARPAAAAPLARALQVLVVDDEPLLRDITAAWLMDDGHTVVTVVSGVAALAQLKGGKFDVVITDRAMPAMNGDQLAAAIYREQPGVPVVLMTGFGDMMQAAGELPPHISAILSKPLTQASLRTALVTAVGVEDSRESMVQSPVN